MAFYLIRHGETALNVARVLQPLDTPLADRGRSQASAVARRMRELLDPQQTASAGAASQPRAILSSDLPRALQTAQTIAEATGLPLSTTRNLHERNFGVLRGRPYDELAFNPLSDDEAPEEGESTTQFQDRIDRAFEEMLGYRRAIGDGGLIVVSHGLVIRTLIARHASRRGDPSLPERYGNTSVTIIDAQPPYAVRLLNCTEHLRGADRDDVHGLSGF